MIAIERQQLWERLQAAGLASGELPSADTDRSPWYVRVMLGIAGWMGALFLLGFVGVGFAVVMKNAGASILVGALVCGGAALMLRAGPKNDFLSQMGLAVSLAGQVMLTYGFSRIFGESRLSIALIVAVQQAVLFWLVPSVVHRVLSAWGGAVAATIAMSDLGLSPLAPAAVSAAFVAVWMNEFRFERSGSVLRAGGWGLACATLQTCVLFGPMWLVWIGARGHREWPGEFLGWVGAAASGAVLFAAALMLLRREGLAMGSPQGRVALAGAAILAAVSLKAPGVGPAVAVLVVGYANGNRVLAGLGIAALVGYLSHYYYALQVTLLEKSALLAAAGVALLALRFAMRIWWPKAEEANHA